MGGGPCVLGQTPGMRVPKDLLVTAQHNGKVVTIEEALVEKQRLSTPALRLYASNAARN